MTDPFPTHDLVRILHERGVQLLRTPGGWMVPSSSRLSIVADPARFAADRGLRPIVRDTTFHVPFFQPRRVVDPTGVPVSRARYLRGYVEDPDRRVYKHMVEHQLYAAVAHLGYLAEAYGGLAVLRNHRRWGETERARPPSSTRLLDSALRHGEAIFTSLGGALEAAAVLVYREPRVRPLSLADALDRVMHEAPAEVRLAVAALDAVHHRVGPTLGPRRDACAARPLAPPTPRPHGDDADLWTVHLPLAAGTPAAPNAGADLLDSAWTTTCEIVRAVEASVPTVFAIAARHPAPHRWRWLTGA